MVEGQRSKRRVLRLCAIKVWSQSGFLLRSCCVVADVRVHICALVCVGAHSSLLFLFIFSVYFKLALSACACVSV